MTPLPPELLRAICESPHDDNLRLIAADWWENEGETERAEFVRVQIDKAKHPGMDCGTMYCSERDLGGLCDSCREYKRLFQREWWLFKKGLCQWEHGQAVFNGAYQLPNEPINPNAITLVYRCGWVDEVHCHSDDWFGRICPKCGAAGCPACRGGYVGGHGPAIVACQPVTRLVATDWQYSLGGLSIREYCHRWLNWARQQAGLELLEAPCAGEK